MDLDALIELVKEQQGIDLSEVLTTADQIKRPERAIEKQAIDDFMKRNPMAGGGRIGFMKGELVKQGPNTGKIAVKDLKLIKDKDGNITNRLTAYFKNMETANAAIQKHKEGKSGQLKYKKSKKIINNPKKLKEFLKYSRGKKITGKMIRQKYKLSNEEFFYGGLRDLIGKDFKQFSRDAASNIKNKTINNINILLNDPEAFSFLKKGQIVPDKIITKLNLAPSAAATATVRIGQIYGGNNFNVDEFKKIRKNIKVSNKLFETMNKFGFGNPYRSKLYKTSLELIDQQLGNDKGTFESLKKKALYILKKNKIKGFDINEIAGVTGTARTGVGEFSQFIDVMESSLNQKQMASFQAAFSKTRQNILNDPNSFTTESKKLNRLAGIFEREYGVKLPRIREVKDVEKYYSPKRLEELKNQGLDIKAASKKLGYTVQMPPGAMTIQEFIDPKNKKKINNLLLNLASTVTNKCSIGNADGGRIGYSLGSEACLKIGKEALDKGLTNGFKNKQQVDLAGAILKGGAGLKSAFALRNIFGPAAIAATVAFEGGLIGYDMLTSGKTLREAFGDNLLNYALGKDYQIDPQEELFKRFKGLGYDNQQIGSIKKSLDTMNTINTGAQLAMDVGQQQEDLQKSRAQPQPFMGPDDQMMADTAGQRAEQNLKDAREKLTAFNQSLEAVDRPGGMKKEDALSKYISSGDYAKGFNLFEQAQKAATVEQMQSPGPTAFGKVFPKFEERRTQTISENLPFGGVNPAFNIPGARDATFIPGKTVGGLFGLAEGGRAGYKLGKIIKPKPSKVRSDAKSIIDENIKLMKQMKETGEIDEISSNLNQVIKQALDEDLFDKKDRIVDSINISEAKKRRNYPYNMQVFEEPKNLDFYRNIKESDFRTKTGPYFDRIRRAQENKAGGGLIGKKSGPPPESGPMSQGLPGLLKRGMKI